MNEERRRILHMLAEGTITVEECQRLLDAPSDAQQEAAHEAAERVMPPTVPVAPAYAPPRARSIGWLVVLAVLLVFFWPVALVLVVVLVPVGIALSVMAIPGLVFLAAIALVFWLCMLISCLARDSRDFGTIIPSDPAADKFVWVLLILFLPVIGAIAYHISIRRRVRRQRSI